MADNSKFGVVASWLIAPTSMVDLIVTDTGVSEELIQPYRQLGIQVELV